MPDTAFMLRGEFYNTFLHYKCAAFEQCVACSLCRNYNPTSLVCDTCEDRKSPKTVCECKDRTRENFINITKKLKTPFNDPNAKENTVSSFDVSMDKNWDSIAAGLQQTYGKLSQVERTETL